MVVTVLASQWRHIPLSARRRRTFRLSTGRPPIRSSAAGTQVTPRQSRTVLDLKPLQMNLVRSSLRLAFKDRHDMVASNLEKIAKYLGRARLGDGETQA